jgi:hypothetical protein
MTIFNGLLKFYAYVFHLAVSTFLIGLAILATTGHEALHLEMLPFNQERLVSRVSMMALVGFICIFLALVRIFEIVFPLWSLGLLVLMVWGFFFTPYSFHGAIGLKGALFLVLATLLALYGSLMVLMPQRRNRW